MLDGVILVFLLTHWYSRDSANSDDDWSSDFSYN